MKRLVWKSFRYRECDEFAAYLKRMAAKGWHFQEWKLGLTFEKKEPADITYEVEVFTEGTELDTRPEPEAMEYAVYCRAAGWKLLDGRRKFCIFQKVQEDAPDIVTPQERFQNIKRAEFSRWKKEAVSCSLVGILGSWNFMGNLFETILFSNLGLACFFFLLVFVLRIAWEGVALAIWSYRTKARLEEGEAPYYGSRSIWGKAARGVRYAIVAVPILLMVLGAVSDGQYRIALFIVAVGICGAAIKWFVYCLRPSRDGKMAAEMGTAFAFWILIVVLELRLVATDSYTESFSPDQEEIPLIQEDYKEVSGVLQTVEGKKTQSFLGKNRCYGIWYGESEDGQEEESLDWIQYEIYESSCPWVLERVWEREAEEGKGMEGSEEADADDLEDGTGAWSALMAEEEETWVCRYRVRYPNQVLIFLTEEPLNAEQIRLIRQKLNLP